MSSLPPLSQATWAGLPPPYEVKDNLRPSTTESVTAGRYKTLGASRVHRDTSLPLQWEPYIHPEGQLYFVRHAPLVIVTEAYLYNSEVMKRISGFAKEVESLLSAMNFEPKDTVELFLQLEDGKDAQACHYYFIDHETRNQFWIHQTDRVTATSHLKLSLQELYWSHVEYFPMHRGTSEQAIEELIGVIALADYTTSSNYTFPYNAEECAEFLALLRRSRDGEPDGYTTCLVGKLWRSVSNYRYICHAGDPREADDSQEGEDHQDGSQGHTARCESLKAVLVHLLRPPLFSLVDFSFFGLPRVYHAMACDLCLFGPIDDPEKFRDEWKAWLRSVIEDFKIQFNIIFFLFGTDFAFLAYAGHSSIAVTLMQCSLACLAVAMLHIVALIQCLKFMTPVNRGRFFAKRARDAASAVAWDPWGSMSLPAVWCDWGFALFALGLFVSIWTDGKRDLASPDIFSGQLSALRVAPTVILTLGMACWLATLATWRKYVAADPETSVV